MRRHAILLALIGAIVAALSAGAPWLPTPRAHAANIVLMASGASGNHTCALGGAGTVKCWGSNDAGQLGNDVTGGFSDTPQDVCAAAGCASVLSGVVFIAAGEHHSCAILSNTTATCWGSNSSGQLGDGTTTGSDTPVTVCASGSGFGCAPLTNVFRISAGAEHTCAVLYSLAVKCWGDNAYGQLGDGNAPNNSGVPVDVCAWGFSYPCFPSNTLFAAGAYGTTSGQNHNCIGASVGLVCWGRGDSGQLGNGASTLAQPLPVIVCNVGTCGSNLTGITFFGAGANHTCAVVAGGGVDCWGSNSQGQLGNGSFGGTSNLPVPVLTPPSHVPLSGAVAAGGGGEHSCAIFSSGSPGYGAMCWGDNSQGQLANNLAPSDSDLAFPVCSYPTCSGWATDLIFGGSLGASHTCGLTVGHNVRCAGDNSLGQLGNGNSPTDNDIGVGVTGLSGKGLTFTVNDIGDAGDVAPGNTICATAGAVCTLRAAIQEANAYPGKDTIAFNIPGGGVQTIAPGTNLPAITDPVIIDGYTQPTASANTNPFGSPDNAALKIAITGGTSLTVGLIIAAGNSEVRGLIVEHFTQVGVYATGAGGNVIAGNYVGTDGTSDVGINQYGVVIDSSPNNTIGGTAPAARNLISGNDIGGIGISAATGSVAGTVVQGNYIGTNAAGTSGIANSSGGIGVAYGASGVTIGGTTPGAANLIAFNGAGGVILGPAGFGADVSAITVRGNSIHDNASLGIDLNGDGVVLANDALDVDSGDNGYQNFPVVTSAQVGSAIIRGTLNSTASSIFLLDFYASTSCDGLGNGEGQTYLGTSAVATDGAGNATFEVDFESPLAVGQAVTATATDTAGNTSEFSACFTATLRSLSKLAGTGLAGDCAEGIAATSPSCLVNQPHGLFEVFPPEGVSAGQGQAASGVPSALYYADTGNNKVKKIQPADATGTDTTVAGGGGSYCDNCTATLSTLSGPRDVFIFGKSLYIADTNNCRVRLVNLVSNGITTVAGSSSCSLNPTDPNGDGGPATSATLNSPRGVAVDAAGNLYIADTLNHRIRKVDTGGTITTIAGTGTASASATAANGDGGPATQATLNQPHDLYFLGEDLVIADTYNQRIRRIDYPAGTISTIAGTGVQDYTGDGLLATQATLRFPEAVMAANDKVVIADTKNHVIRMVDLVGHSADPSNPTAYPAVAPGTITTVADQQSPCRVPSPPSPCQLDQPAGVFIVTGPTAADGALRVSNTLGQTIVTAGVDPTGTQTPTIRPTVSCGNVPGVSSIDWALPLVLLGLVFGRKRFGTLFSRLSCAARRLAPAPSAAR